MQDRQQKEMTFQFFNEIGIIQQLVTTMFNRRLPDGLHISHFSVLNHLTRLGDGKTPLSIARAFQVTKGTMTNTLGGLEKRRLIDVRPNEADGRSKLVFLTSQGREFHQSAIADVGQWMGQLGPKMDLEGMASALPMLVQLRKILDENRDI